MHDLVVRGGTIVDGTGKPAYGGDVAIDGGILTAVSGRAGPARREIDASGAIVTPGFVDIHTHYDGQATWDPLMSPSCWHGVTTALFGNCGVGFAPVRPEHRGPLIELMEGVEDIPGITLAEGLKWDWESFPEYLNALDRLPRVMDVAAQIPHHPLRVYVMGERGLRRERATAEDIAAMFRLTEEALRAGAFGFTTSRTQSHRTVKGDLVPGQNADVEELLGIGRAFGRVGRGVFGMMSDFVDETAEFAWLERLVRENGCPAWFLLTDHPSDPDRWRRLAEHMRQSRVKGLPIFAEVAGRPVGVLLAANTSINPFSMRPSYQALLDMSPDDRLTEMRKPATRARILADAVPASFRETAAPLLWEIATGWDRMYVMGETLDYEPSPDKSVAAIARATNRLPDEVAYDYLANSAEHFLFYPTTGYTQGDHDVIAELLQADGAILGLGDAGAHCGMIVDASLPTFMLTHWSRDRSRGPRLGLEQVVRMQTSATAGFYGFHDRGALKPGLRADLNVIDLPSLTLEAPEVVHDLPAQGRRLIQKARGYVATVAGGVPTFERGEHTGALPGRLVRAA
ncbi:N-acyl-D-amino-acid deacylase family protein [Rhizorhabdus dicambivorans]|uniref:Amidohydrolase n=1 Tax=Rhizorhabdus dicambivorans TaxID=1850238 RepID=A0A2A4FXW4_9SPHN|nr:amidohydrolase family protein [Rhizorhabdus dicambivorans]ATE64186.1 amidohydrolase [Rhizorhabdus dicambivorans]PCE42542.1 amidohydrolase [Rhizorhabdus dicambivorans]